MSNEPREAVERPLVHQVATAIHYARFPAGREPTPFSEADERGREYCLRLAEAALSALSHTIVTEEMVEVGRWEANRILDRYPTIRVPDGLRSEIVRAVLEAARLLPAKEK
jgi:hypothetical protein